MTTKNQQKQEAKDRLLSILKPGDTITCVLRSVSRSGMFRRIDFYHFDKDGGKHWLTASMAKLINARYSAEDWKQSKGLGVSGCGMDMGFSCVYELGHSLWPNGTTEPHSTRNGEPDKDGGYALKSTWL